MYGIHSLGPLNKKFHHTEAGGMGFRNLDSREAPRLTCKAIADQRATRRAAMDEVGKRTDAWTRAVWRGAATRTGMRVFVAVALAVACHRSERGGQTSHQFFGPPFSCAASENF